MEYSPREIHEISNAIFSNLNSIDDVKSACDNATIFINDRIETILINTIKNMEEIFDRYEYITTEETNDIVLRELRPIVDKYKFDLEKEINDYLDKYNSNDDISNIHPPLIENKQHTWNYFFYWRLFHIDSSFAKFVRTKTKPILKKYVWSRLAT